jgi:hypothetical protein
MAGFGEDFESSVNKHLGGIVDMVHQQIDENPFLARFQKQDFFDMLNEARKDIGQARRDARSAVRESLSSVADAFRQQAGKHINVSKFFGSFGHSDNK